MTRPKAPPRAALTLIFTLVMFLVLSITMLIVGGTTFLLVRAGVLTEIIRPDIPFPIAVFALASVLIGTAVAAIVSRIPLRPVHQLIAGMNRLAAGNFDTEIHLGKSPTSKDLSDSFNLLASELKNTEMLRSDFINNFSHEFKTPIVSIRGFAKLLQKGNLPESKQKEYLSIIVDESSRLTDLATNILNLTKVENQKILTDVTRFNLSEQIRDCILLLEKKWTRKALTIVADFDEHMVLANEELLMQVWINLIDNAVKFSNEGGEMGVSLSEQEACILVQIKNNGPQISSEDQNRIFHKFWQGDTSHTSEGTGIGLSIAYQIVQLHKGTISVHSNPTETVFTVSLPK